MGLDLKARVSLDGSGWETGLNKLQSSVSGFASGIKNIVAGAFTVGAIADLSKRTLNYAGQLNDLSTRLGVSTDFLQEFAYMAKQTGTDLEDLTKIMEKFNESRNIALGGGDEGQKMLDKFKVFGLTKNDLKHTRNEDSISNKIAPAFERGDPQGALGAAWKVIGGKSAGKLIAGFQEGFAQAREMARAHGRIWTEDQIQQMDDFGDHMSQMGDLIQKEWGNIMLTVFGWLRKLGGEAETALNYVVGGTSEWTGKDWAANILDFLNPFSKVGAHGKAFDTNLATQTAVESMEDIKQQLKAEQDAREKARAARALLRTAQPDVQPTNVATKGHKFDEGGDLLKVGNFLGTNQASITRAADTANRLLRSIDQRLLQLLQTRNNPTSMFPL